LLLPLQEIFPSTVDEYRLEKTTLARAQHRMQQHPKFSAPYYWAGFVVVD